MTGMAACARRIAAHAGWSSLERLFRGNCDISWPKRQVPAWMGASLRPRRKCVPHPRLRRDLSRERER